MKVKILSLLLIVFFTQAYAQKNPLKKAYEKANSMLFKKDSQKTYVYLSQKYPENLYGQYSLMELGKLSYFEDNYADAISFFKKIFVPEIVDKSYWLAKAYLQNSEFHNAIISSQNYISDSNDRQKCEDAYFIIAEGYLKRKMYDRSLSTLLYLKTSKYIKDQIPLLLYKLGYCYQNMGKYYDALSYFKKLKKEYPYDHYANLADDQMLEINKKGNFNPKGSGTTVSHKNTKAMSPKKNNSGKQKYYQTGAYSTKKSAENMKNTLKNIGLDCSIFTKTKNGKKLYITAVGPFHSKSESNKIKNILQKNKISNFIITH